MNQRALLAGGLLFMMGAIALHGKPSVDIDVKVREPDGINRQSEPVTSGIPLPRGFSRLHKLVLTDASGKTVPCQFSPLGKRDDGNPYWVLLDFQTDVPAKQTAAYKLQDTGGNPSPAQPVQVKESGSSIRINTGPLSFDISRKNFNFIENVTLDGKKILDPGKTPALRIVEGAADNRLNSLGVPPYRVEVEYAGPMRACIRVDGVYTTENKYFLHYTMRIEAFSGKPDVAVSWKIRNSQKLWAFNAFVKKATLDTRLKGGGDVVKPANPGKDGWIAVNGDSASMALMIRFAKHHDNMGLTAQSDGVISFEPFAGPGWIEKHMEYEWQFLYRFKKEPFASEDSKDMAATLRRRLLALAPGEWYQECDALGGPIGMLDDEIATYKDWGWTIRDRGRPRPSNKRFVSYLGVHDVSETDSARDNLWQYIRTGNRGFFDVGEAYALYYRNPYTIHWDENFDPDTLVPGTELERTPFPRIRRNTDAMKKLRRSRMCTCHSYYAGLVDHYLLTGERASLEAAEAFGQFIEDEYKNRVPGEYNPDGGRYFGRPFGNICRLYEVTRKPRWKDLMTRMARLALEAPDRDERGIISSSNSASQWNKYAATQGGRTLLAKLGDKGIYPQPIPTKGWSSWELSIFNYALGRYYDITGDEDARDMLIAQAWFMVRYAMEPVHQYTGYTCVLDFPRKGDAFFPRMSGVPHGPDCRHNGWYTCSCPDNCTRGYRLTGRKEFLEMAKRYWNRGSKIGYRQRESSRIPDDKTGRFASARDPKDGNLMYVKELFYSWQNQKEDNQPPAPIRKLKARATGKGSVRLEWKAPSDNSGKAAAYQVKWAAMPIKEYKGYNYLEDEGKIRCWWRAHNVDGEPVPGNPGKKETFVINDLPSGSLWFAIRSDDAEMNQSDISNVVKVNVE